MASSMISNTTTTTTPPTSDRSHRIKKKKKAQSKAQQAQEQQQRLQSHAKWRSQAQQQIYSSKLHQALSRVNLSGGPRRGKAVREAADRVLATAAKGRTRWSRAILTNKLRLKFRKQKRNHNQQKAIGPARSKKARFGVLRLKGKTLPAVQRKVKVLGRLVPGCRKEPLPVILEEAIDYIPALEMQVRAMAALADLLFGSSSSAVAAGSADSSGLPPQS
ncbi:basic helix-loop-helix (bHLH) DNA-binding superfamily protein [Trifolium repens]|nr:basic helix-loop-helix (bHLH) DNA-binding superfamily protein [Trifolium repens]